MEGMDGRWLVGDMLLLSVGDQGLGLWDVSEAVVDQSVRCVSCQV
jgi:hypothetical protein